MGVSSNMALKVVVLILASIGFACSENSHCSAYADGTNDGRDCSCADRFFGECMELSTGSQLLVANLEECKSLCSVWSTCEWFIFDRSVGDRLNCKMFSTGQVSMADYLQSCNVVGGALRNEVDTCLGDLLDWLCSDDNVCPGGCSSCAGDRCNDFAETECPISLPEQQSSTTIPNALGCQNVMSGMSNHATTINYFLFDQYGEVCTGYESGERNCRKVVAAKNLDLQSCQTGTQ